MSIPDFQSLMLPLLCLAGDGLEHGTRNALEVLSAQFRLTDEERQRMLPCGGGRAVMQNRVGWALSYLKAARLLEAPRRAFFRITERGRSVLTSKPLAIDVTFLERFAEFVEFRGRRRERTEVAVAPAASLETPEEEIRSAYERVRSNLASELLQAVKTCSPSFFESLVLDLLVKMGYGGTREDAANAVGGSHDGGIDGIIKEDRLGLDVVYVQAKRWESSVGRPDIQKFAGALQGRRARKGIFITTSSFSKEATDFASAIENKIVLIDGVTLSELMIDYGLGVSITASYDLKRLDADYFTEE